MTRLLLLFGIACSWAQAHVISMSTGDAEIRGNRVDYVLHLPQYEMKQGVDPVTGLLDRLHFRAQGETAKRAGGECHSDPGKNQYVCAAVYEWGAAATGSIEVECRFFEVTSPNHVHMLRAKRGDAFDRAILDATFSSATLTFRPPTPFEITIAQFSAGAFRVFSSVAQILLICVLGFAARNWREAGLALFGFVALEALSAYALSRTGWQISPRFTEAAVALGLAYLAVELLFWPKGGGRWMLALPFGAFSGMYFSLFLSESGFRPANVVSGALVASGALLLICAGVRRALERQRLLPARATVLAGKTAAGCLLASSAIWFLLRMRS